ncbi:hypothetical protein BTHERMOSOX_176 [Bathymodiolus thermophilus thioautotrophic gill symbiont]|jgi:heme-degrading monooxygenase HmoA|uniref:ABM domain-containing protein n=1 Tax=Bathymodiolus thermophilus thioautotrophic gill symbiont TaxID=2360 RepID=A0A1J5UH31_9GAMM|nr:hypothetical protein [Bathymodiolus thermophilus thioautotrophic gill symbiont]AYQ57347.1 hypothetical protein MS2017_1668 [Bathymodiolus thermophilus thioautotrophic gill symbiont]OIR25213.1 hypothetical protein BGC33_05735 [Bathymodiolus thermophilus thioautotrophic gill symbiont]CAB5504495.1 hypothetical protein THERMOS_1969 [Bathymodiolus thermophilus thioautotrophic gill symbiont]SGZ78972.1 hypothetical protein BTHERMOSOX_176 [Bathymodiolus thermophilus thioautotrophic gill symbiont]
MSEYFVIMSFELNEKDLIDDWTALSKEIDEDIAKADGFISRDSGIDEHGRVYCLVKWQSKAHQETFKKLLEARQEWPQMMQHFSSIVNIETSTNQAIEIF